MRLRLVKSSRPRHQLSVPMDIERDGNLIEASFWLFLGSVVFICSWRQELRLRPTLRILAITLVVFGASDVVEARTGAWWKPWWLFVWKAACILVLLLGFIRLTKKVPGAKSG